MPPKTRLTRRQFTEGWLSSMFPTKEPPISRIEDNSYSIDCGNLQCVSSRQGDGSWQVTVSLWEHTQAFGVKTSDRMVPSEALRRKLMEAGIPTDFDEGPVRCNLIGRVPSHMTPQVLLGILSRIHVRPSDFSESADDAIRRSFG